MIRRRIRTPPRIPTRSAVGVAIESTRLSAVHDWIRPRVIVRRRVMVRLPVTVLRRRSMDHCPASVRMPAYAPPPLMLFPAFSPDPPRFWLRSDYLVWWTKGAPLPPLVTTGSTSDSVPGASRSAWDEHLVRRRQRRPGSDKRLAARSRRLLRLPRDVGVAIRVYHPGSAGGRLRRLLRQQRQPAHHPPGGQCEQRNRDVVCRRVPRLTGRRRFDHQHE